MVLCCSLSRASIAVVVPSWYRLDVASVTVISDGLRNEGSCGGAKGEQWEGEECVVETNSDDVTDMNEQD